MGITTRDDVVVLAGREFKRVKNGLDEAQVTSFINELIKERDKLAQTYEHISSLSRLAERVVVEADKLATQIKTEALEQAKAESAAIIDKAREEARLISERKVAEALQRATEQAKAIRAKAEEEAAQLLENEKNKIRAELRNFVNQQFRNMLQELESLKQRAAAVQASFDDTLSQPGVDGTATIMKVTEGKDTEVAKATEEKETVVTKIAENRETAAAEISQESAAIVADELEKALAKQIEPSQTANQIEKNSDLSNLFQIEDQIEYGKPQWEVEILPPFEIARVMELVSFLDQIPEVANTEMIVPQIDTPSILVFLRKPLNLIDVLRTIPVVAYIESVTTNMDTSNGKPTKVRISLLGNTKSPGKK